MPKTYLKNSVIMVLLLSSVMALVLLPTTLKRGLFFREDYLPFLTRVAALFAIVSVIAVLRGDNIWRGDIDILLALIVGLYFLTTIWAQSKMDAVDGALKYAGYLMVFIMARYACSDELGNRVLRNLLLACGLVVASAGYLTAAGLAAYPAAVQAGALLGSFQYPNALAAFAMFLLFFLYYAWYEGFRNPALDLLSGILYSASAFLLVGSVFLTNSRATLLMFAGFMALYGVLLPKGDRAKILARAGVSFLSFASVASRMDTALKKNDAASMKQGLLIGLTLAAVLEIVRWLLDRRMSKVPSAAPEVAGTAVEAKSAGASLRTVFLRAAIAGLAVVLASAALIAAVKNPATAGALAKVLPERVIAQLKTLSLTDRSMLTRFMATKDAILIALDHPFGTGAGGWQALYHRYQTTLYWFTETHNHFAQMLVEVGFPGLLLYTAFWGVLTYAAIKTYLAQVKEATSGQLTKTDSPAGGPKRGVLPRVTSSAVAVFALGVHSAMDFDLSLPAISVALFVSIAVLLLDIGEVLPRTSSWGLIRKLRQPNSPDKKKASRKTLTGQAFPWSMAVTLLAAAVLTSSVALTANRLYRGMVYGSAAMKAFESDGFSKARQYMTHAMERDKWNPAYPLQLAKWSLQDYLADKDATVRETVMLYLRLAEVAAPNSLGREQAETQMLKRAELYDDAVRSAYRVVEMVPANRAFHESLADIGRIAISEHMKNIAADKTNGKDVSEHLDKLSECAELLTSAFDILDAKRERVTGIYATVFNPKQLEFTPKIALAAGELAFLRGDIESGAAHLSAAANDKALAQEASTWLSYLAEATGHKVTLPEGFASNPEETRKMAALFGVLSERK